MTRHGHQSVFDLDASLRGREVEHTHGIHGRPSNPFGRALLLRAVCRFETKHLFRRTAPLISAVVGRHLCRLLQIGKSPANEGALLSW